MNNFLFHVYHDENISWRSTLEIQRKEIPGMSRILAEIVKDNPGERYINNAKHLQRRLEEQEKAIGKITMKIDLQQSKLEVDEDEAKTGFSSLDTLYGQEELRDEVLKFEKSFLDFKQNFHHYLLTML
jgi:CII-binding regulator of phage lambda lysogenization HflD